tara:strand:- start:4236 stop:4469 length:234 start_codon:yes stop_codon:yes gene_type:complete
MSVSVQSDPGFPVVLGTLTNPDFFFGFFFAFATDGARASLFPEGNLGAFFPLGLATAEAYDIVGIVVFITKINKIKK